MNKRIHRDLFLIFGLLVLSALAPAWAVSGIWEHPNTPVDEVIVTSLGEAPLLGEVPNKAALKEAAATYEWRLREALQIMGHSGPVTEEVVRRLKAGEVTQVTLPNGTVLDTFGWYGRTKFDHTDRVIVFGMTKLKTGRDLPAWQTIVRIEEKEVRFVLPFKCGNLARWGWRFDKVTIVEELPPPLPGPVPQARLGYAPAVQRSSIDTGRTTALGSTSSSIALYPGAPDINVNQIVNVPGRAPATLTISSNAEAATSTSASGAGGAAAGGAAGAGAGDGSAAGGATSGTTVTVTL